MSKEMACLDRVWNDINNKNDFRNDFKDLSVIRQALEALEIIKNKYMEIRFNDEERFIEFTDLEKHYTYLYFSENEKEQYNLLKEVLGDE